MKPRSKLNSIERNYTNFMTVSINKIDRINLGKNATIYCDPRHANTFSFYLCYTSQKESEAK